MRYENLALVQKSGVIIGPRLLLMSFALFFNAVASRRYRMDRFASLAPSLDIFIIL
nr:hypothetical protein [Cressdnaviricota sp.]UOF83000.1 hypothetical protein [Cressdnaviricota sp.]